MDTKPEIEVTTGAHIFIIITIIIISGCLGGVVNYFMNNISKTWDKYEFTKSLIFGIVAAAVVPLFLKTVASGLLHDSKKDILEYFVFTGFCLLASVFSSKFLQSLADKILKELTELKSDNARTKEKLDTIVNQKSDDVQTNTFVDTELKLNEGEDLNKVITAFQNEKFTFRTIAGLFKETSINQISIAVILNQLKDKGYIRQFERLDGTVLFTLTLKGWQLALPKTEIKTNVKQI